MTTTRDPIILTTSRELRDAFADYDSPDYDSPAIRILDLTLASLMTMMPADPALDALAADLHDDPFSTLALNIDSNDDIPITLDDIFDIMIAAL